MKPVATGSIAPGTTVVNLPEQWAWGRFKGRLIRSLPTPFIDWALTQAFPIPYRAALIAERDLRQLAADQQGGAL